MMWQPSSRMCLKKTPQPAVEHFVELEDFASFSAALMSSSASISSTPQGPWCCFRLQVLHATSWQCGQTGASTPASS
jgi:hypothetical protein